MIFCGGDHGVNFKLWSPGKPDWSHLGFNHGRGEVDVSSNDGHLGSGQYELFHLFVLHVLRSSGLPTLVARDPTEVLTLEANATVETTL